jgi:hypothetical protein
MEEQRPQQSGASTLHLVRGIAAVGVSINAIGSAPVARRVALRDGCNQQDKAADVRNISGHGIPESPSKLRLP